MLEKFETVGLEYFHNDFSFLKRVETKFLLNKNKLNLILSNLQDDYCILQIDGKKVFTYNTIYFDTENFVNYYQHHQGKRLRKKIRTRLYEDNNSCFFELKLKNKTNTIKKRKEIGLKQHGVFDKDMAIFSNDYIQKYYSKDGESKNLATIGTRYKRITLINKTSYEKITFDYDFHFFNLRNNKSDKKTPNPVFFPLKSIENKDMMIVEIKSFGENASGNKKIKKLGFRQIEYGCSKYCLGLNLLNLVNKGNKFKPILKKIQKI